MEPPPANQHTFVFADLAGFTALTEAHGDERAADIALEFCDSINRLLPDDAEDLKMLGDACLLRVGRADEALRLGLSLTAESAPRHGFPDVRVGMHTGGAARRGNDWFGSVLNTAARVAELAGPSEVLLTFATRQSAASLDGVAFEDKGMRELRHIPHPVHLYRARAIGATEPSERWVDPVCRMRLAEDRAAASLTHAGTEYFFCSKTCAERYSDAPERYSPA